MKFFSILEQIWTQVAKYSEFWSLNFNRVHPHIPSLMTPPPSPHNRVQNKRVLHCCRLLYLRVVQRVLKTHWDSRRLDWTHLGRCEHPLTLESDWTGLGRCEHPLTLESDCTGLGRCEHPLTLESDCTGLDSTRLCCRVRTLRRL